MGVSNIASNKQNIVLDASIILKRFLPEENSPSIRSFIPYGAQQLAPSIVEFELRSALCKHVGRGNLGKEMLDEAISVWDEMVSDNWLEVIQTHEYINDAVELSCLLKHPLYDCCYIAVARKENCALITADKKLYERGKTVYPNIILVT